MKSKFRWIVALILMVSVGQAGWAAEQVKEKMETKKQNGEKNMNIYYRPADGLVGDVIPFYWKGNYHLFHLKVCNGREGLPWFEMVTKDFAKLEDWGEVLPNGGKDEQDLNCGTGSIFEWKGTFHLFYVGQNPALAKQGKPPEVMLHATSPDLRHWTKDKDFYFPPATESGYELSAWRDAFVFRNEEAGEFWMLITARRGANVPEKRRGCTAVAASKDLKTWTMREPLWAPDLYDTHECPDLFKMGDWWYLVYSSYSGYWATHYRMARSLKGPWLAPPDDLFDGNAFYAAKTAGDGERRYICGWITNRQEDKDDANWMWGGNMVIHEMLQRPDGTFGVRMPEGVQALFKTSVKMTPKPVVGKWKIEDAAFSTNSVGRFSAITLGAMADPCMIEVTVTPKSKTSRCGVMLRTTETLESGYQICLDPVGQRMTFDHWPRPVGGHPFSQERPLTIKPGHPVKLRLVVEGNILVAYADDQVALSTRMYEHKGGTLALYVSEGEAKFDNVRVLGRD